MIVAAQFLGQFSHALASPAQRRLRVATAQRLDQPKGAPEPYHSYLAHFDRQPSKARCLKLSRSRWHVEQYFQRSKDDLGLDHFEGRSWRGFHHHLALSALAYLFILTIYLEAKKNFWSDVGEDPGIDPALAAAIDRTLSLLPRYIP